jgi:hypothetical protein
LDVAGASVAPFRQSAIPVPEETFLFREHYLPEARLRLPTDLAPDLVDGRRRMVATINYGFEALRSARSTTSRATSSIHQPAERPVKQPADS